MEFFIGVGVGIVIAVIAAVGVLCWFINDVTKRL